MLDEIRSRHEGADDYVQFLGAGAPARGEFQCADCGYGVAVQATLPQCPMCAGTTWERVLRGAVWQTATSAG